MTPATRNIPGILRWTRNILAVLAFTLLSACIHELDKIEGKAPPIPTNVSVLGLDGAIQITWDIPPVNVPHNLYWSVDGGPEEVIENISSPYFHQGLVNGALYTYQLTATNNAGESPRTAPVTTMPVVFNWQENWGIAVDQGNNPQCNDDDNDATQDTQCRIVSNDNNTWFTSRYFAGQNPNAILDDPLTYLKFFQNFNMRANGIDYSMESELGLNMTVEQLQESSLEVRSLNVPVGSYTELFVRAFEAVMPGISEYAYMELQPATFIAGDTCNGINLRYVFATANNMNAPVTAPDNTVKIIELGGEIGDFYRKDILSDLTCSENEYVIGTVKLGIEGIQGDNNWIRWQNIGIVGPPLPGS